MRTHGGDGGGLRGLCLGDRFRLQPDSLGVCVLLPRPLPPRRVDLVR